MNLERLEQIERTLCNRLFPHGGFEEVRELIEAVRQRLIIDELPPLPECELFCCPACGHIDDMNQETGFWEKGVNENDEDLYDCPVCDERVVARPATLDDYHKAVRAAIADIRRLDSKSTTPPSEAAK